LTQKQINVMKKAMIIFAASLTLAACGGSSTEQTSTDSVFVDSVVVDTTEVVTDSVTVK